MCCMASQVRAASLHFRYCLSRPNVKLSHREIIWLAFSLTKDMTVDMTKELALGEFKLRQ